jgi:predicted nucleic acid-binding protein
LKSSTQAQATGIDSNLKDWTQAGRVLAHLAAKYDYEQVGQGRLTNDALIAMSAGRLGIRVITAKKRDFGSSPNFGVSTGR